MIKCLQELNNFFLMQILSKYSLGKFFVFVVIWLFIVRDSEETGVDPEILQVMGFGAVSFMILFTGLVLLNYSIHNLRAELESLNREIDKEGIN